MSRPSRRARSPTSTAKVARSAIPAWAYVEPEPGRYDTAYLRAATAQLQAFPRQGFRAPAPRFPRHGRHHEAMNGNTGKILTEGDATRRA
jgi:hypothetical protein